MRVVIFCHSLVSCWNHGNAHFLRGLVSELIARGHDVDVQEPADAWSAANLVAEGGSAALYGWRAAYPGLESVRYEPEMLDLDRVLDGADLVIVHEWNDPALVKRIGEHRARARSYRLFFHDTHHRAATAPEQMAAYDLSHYDGVLAFGNVIREIYLDRGWAARAWTFHEAADVRVFRPLDGEANEGDLVWIGNWGDEERTAELHEFLLDPVKRLGIRAKVHGVRYPHRACAALAEAGIEYGGWLPNHAAPRTFARHRLTVHVPRRPYTRALPGIPTIRPFEALACGIPLVSAPWEDVENLFTPGRDYLVARSGEEMALRMRDVLHDPDLARALATHGLRTIRARHTCAHRIDQLLAILASLETPASRERGTAKNEGEARA